MTAKLTNKIHYFAKLDSTMLQAKRYLTTKQECPQLIVAGEQSQGRGRFGRIWFAPKGNLYISHIQPITHPIEQIPLIVGVAVAEVLIGLIPCHPRAGEDPFICQSSMDPRLRGDDRQSMCQNQDERPTINLKHPNDVLVDGKKICGILIEKYDPFYSVGVGINVASSPLVQFYETTYVHKYNKHVTVGFLLRYFLKRYHSLLTQDFSDIQSSHNKLCHQLKCHPGC